MVRWLIPAVVAAVLSGLWWRRRGSVDRQRRLMLLCRRAGLEFAPLDLSPDTAWLPFPMFGHPRHGTENVVWERGEDVRAFDFWYPIRATSAPSAPGEGSPVPWCRSGSRLLACGSYRATLSTTSLGSRDGGVRIPRAKREPSGTMIR